jgi:hypothetical protein
VPSQPWNELLDEDQDISEAICIAFKDPSGFAADPGAVAAFYEETRDVIALP